MTLQTQAARSPATQESRLHTPLADASPDNVMRVLRWEDERSAAALLGRAFADDPLVIAICDAPARDCEQRMRWGFRIAIRSHCLTAQPAWTATVAGEQIAGVVLVTRPRSAAPANIDVLFALWGLLHIGIRVGRRGATAARAIAEHLPAGPFTYLRTLGVEPDLQNRGIGSRLVEQVARTAAPGLPIYLETAKAENLEFYGRHGFHCLGEFRCLDVPVWRLLRPASTLVMHSSQHLR